MLQGFSLDIVILKLQDQILVMDLALVETNFDSEQNCFTEGHLICLYIAQRQNNTSIEQAHEFLAMLDDRLFTSH